MTDRGQFIDQKQSFVRAVTIELTVTDVEKIQMDNILH